jgi:hypothetical protein
VRDAPENRRSEHCLNCGAATPGNFCSVCGQRNTHYRVSTWEILGEAASELFQLDSRLTKTLGTLLFRPGKLTSEYVAGRRVRYSPPLRVYLVSSLFYFLALTSFALTGDKEEDRPPAAAREDAKQSGTQKDESGLTIKVDGDPDSALSRAIKDRIEYFKKPTTVDAKERYVNALVGQIPKAMFLLLPVFALCLKLVYLRRRRYYSEHLVFALHVHAFAFVTLLIATLTRQMAAVGYALLVSLLYLYLALRRVYGQGKMRTFLKWNIVLFLYFWAMLAAFVIAALLAFAIG